MARLEAHFGKLAARLTRRALGAIARKMNWNEYRQRCHNIQTLIAPGAHLVNPNVKNSEQISSENKSSPNKRYRTSPLIVRIMAITIIVLVLMSIKLAFSIHILAALLFVIPFLIILLASYSVAVIDIFCGKEYMEVRRLKIFPPMRIAWRDIRDVKWERGKRLLIYLHEDPHPVQIETLPVARLDGEGLIRIIRERADLL